MEIVENGNCGKWKLRKMEIVENGNCGKYKLRKMRTVEYELMNCGINGFLILQLQLKIELGLRPRLTQKSPLI